MGRMHMKSGSCFSGGFRLHVELLGHAQGAFGPAGHVQILTFH